MQRSTRPSRLPLRTVATGAVVALLGSLLPLIPASATAAPTAPTRTAAQDQADAAAAALGVVHADDVRGHLTLPTSGPDGATVTWASSDPDVVAADGVVHRPASGAGDTEVTLTATAEVGDATAVREIPLTVREAPAVEPYEGYAFSYFTGNSVAGEKIYFAASRGNDALTWDETNSGQPVLESGEGTPSACGTRS